MTSYNPRIMIIIYQWSMWTRLIFVLVGAKYFKKKINIITEGCIGPFSYKDPSYNTKTKVF